MVLALEFFVAPRLIGASKHLDMVERLQPAWATAAVASEAASLAAYAMLLRALLADHHVRFGRMFRIVLATTAFGHVTPAAGAGGAGLGYALLHDCGIDGASAGFALGTASLGSAVVLNVMLWVALLVSIPLAGLHPIYVVTALLGLLAITAVALLVYALTRGEERAVRIVRAVGRRVPRVGADRMEAIVRMTASSIEHLTSDRQVMRKAGAWAAANWALDAAALWFMLAALHHYTEPFELFAAYGISNVAAAIPVTPGGLGVIDAAAPTLLVSFGVAKNTAAFGVLGWRLLSYWLPIPIGGIAYLTLRHDSGDN